MDDDLFTYEVDVSNIPRDSNKDDDSEQRVSREADYDMGYDPSDIRGDDEVELTDEEFSDNEDKVADTYEEYKDDWIYEWNIDVPWVDEKPWTDTGKNDGYCNEGNLPGAYIVGNLLHYQDYKWYEALKDSELKEQALKNKAIMEGLISDDESCNDRLEIFGKQKITNVVVLRLKDTAIIGHEFFEASGEGVGRIRVPPLMGYDVLGKSCCSSLLTKSNCNGVTLMWIRKFLKVRQ
ncbi:hypothetical protein Tco_0998582 [Tanacetum coccineum]